MFNFKVINKLLENRKIAHATHNMYAYRIKNGNEILCYVIITLFNKLSCLTINFYTKKFTLTTSYFM